MGQVTNQDRNVNEADRDKTKELEERIRIVYGVNINTPDKLPDTVYQRGDAKDGTPANHFTFAGKLEKVFGKKSSLDHNSAFRC